MVQKKYQITEVKSQKKIVQLYVIISLLDIFTKIRNTLK